MHSLAQIYHAYELWINIGLILFLAYAVYEVLQGIFHK